MENASSVVGRKESKSKIIWDALGRLETTADLVRNTREQIEGSPSEAMKNPEGDPCLAICLNETPTRIDNAVSIIRTELEAIRSLLF